WCRLWVIHFRDGKDRRHHPEICYKVAGKTEDRAAGARVDVGDPEAVVERFCFSGNDDRSSVYYWHYTLEPPAAAEVSPLRRIYQRRARPLPTVPLAVFTTPLSPPDLDRTAAFVRLADQALRRCLPPGARMGSDVLPIRLLSAPVRD